MRKPVMSMSEKISPSQASYLWMVAKLLKSCNISKDL